ncbi:VanZ family protein [Curtobacterium sp. MCBA15_001]|uniref:VanZ family protein n=1 Tax=Curtobacterium sp. MCBA15_001 TaxID=1898731 RepID=UPI0008DE994B|nr:VanZ family protein [Curtobacterium sp. MCBA15_001]OIH96491.1 hypothetical protein BIU90_16715 [Curtobacterium sp. MCBA15_001]
MISTVLAEHPTLVRVLFWVVVAACALVGWWLHRRGARATLTVLTVLALLGVAALTLSPSGDPGPVTCTVQFSVPFTGLDTLANVALLLPAVLFGALAAARPTARPATSPLAVFLAGSGLSAVIETVQMVVPGLGRACDTDDWWMNTIGAAIGAVLSLAILVLDRRRRRILTSEATAVPAESRARSTLPASRRGTPS